MPDSNGFLLSSAGIINLDENTSSLTIKSTDFSTSYNKLEVDVYAYWYVASPPGSRVVVEYQTMQTGGWLSVYDVVDTSSIQISSFSDTLPAPGHTVFSGNEATFYMYSGNNNVEGVIYTLSVTGS